jgi:hypothetical protein
MSRFVEVAKKSEIPETGVIGVEVEGKRLALISLSLGLGFDMLGMRGGK